MEEQNPTPGNEGASTLDRLERYLAASDTPDTPKQDDQPQGQDKPADGAASDDVDSENDGNDKATEPQLSTSDLAKYLGIDEAALDLDEDGTVKLKTKVDGVEGAAKLQDLLKSYQLQEHVDKKSREASEREKALTVRQQEVEQHVAKRLEYAENLVNVAAQDMMREFQSINWPELEQINPGHAALLRQKFNDRQAQLRQVHEQVEQNKQQMQYKAVESHRENIAKEAQKLTQMIPEWSDPAVVQKESQEIRQWALKNGFEQQELDTLIGARHVAVLRAAMLNDKLRQSKPVIENRVRTAPKLVKPGQAPTDTAEAQVRSLKQSVVKSGGKNGSLEAFLLKTGRV